MLDAADAATMVADPIEDAEHARALRERARTLLACLERAREECESNLRRLKQPDAMKQVTGSSALDNAIARTRETIDVINRRIGDGRATSAALAPSPALSAASRRR